MVFSVSDFQSEMQILKFIEKIHQNLKNSEWFAFFIV